jgi:hypothetical protein
MTTFSQAVANEMSSAIKLTENGAKAFETSDSKVLDFFGMVGSSRGKDLSKQFLTALAEDPHLAIRALLWTRDARGGAGERGQFRTLLTALETFDPAYAGRIMSKIPMLGRWDDLFAYMDPLNRKAALEFYAEALRNGVAAKSTLEKLEDMTEEQCQALLDKL